MFSKRQSQNINDRFLSLLELLNSFHEDYGIPECQDGFNILARICAQMQRLFSADSISKDANTFISSLSGAIQTHLPRIVAVILERSRHVMADKELSIKLMERVVKITTNLNRLVTAYELFIASSQDEGFVQVPASAAVEPEPNDARILQLIESLRQAPESRQNMNSNESADMILVDLESQFPIAKREDRTPSCCSFFSRAITHYPKTMAASAMTTTMAFAYSGLSVLSHYAGSTLDTWLHTDETGVSHQIIIAVTLLLTGSLLATTALVMNCKGNTEMEQVENNASERARLI